MQDCGTTACDPKWPSWFWCSDCTEKFSTEPAATKPDTEGSGFGRGRHRHQYAKEMCTDPGCIYSEKTPQTLDAPAPPAPTVTELPVGTKHDEGKASWSLLPFGPVKDIVAVLDYGAKKYSPEGWRRVDNARTRYFNAAMRHLTAWWEGERNDPESGLPHLAHAGCCLLFLAAFDKETK